MGKRVSAGFAERAVPALVAVVAFAAPGTASAETATGFFSVSVIVQPSCAVSVPSELRSGSSDARTADPAGALDVACTTGTTWSAAAEPEQAGAAELRQHALQAASLPLRYSAARQAIAFESTGEGEPSNLVRITIRY